MRQPNRRDWATASLSGGLETRLQPNKLTASFSPDLDNVVLNDGAVSKRGGFTPFIREHPPLNAIRNRGFTRDSNVGGTNATARVVPGALLAGDRQQYDNVDKVTLDFFCQPDDLTTQSLRAVAGNDTFNYYSSITDPVDIKVRPILSKGQSKKAILANTFFAENADRSGADTLHRNQIQWDPSVSAGVGARQHAATAAYSGSVITLTTLQPHGIATGTRVRLTGTSPNETDQNGGGDGNYTATVTGATTLTVPSAFTGGRTEVTLYSPPETIGQGIPWVVYLFNAGSATIPNWQFRFTVTARNTSSQFVLRTATSTVPVVVGETYHVLASVDWSQALVLKIGRRNEGGSFDYTEVTVDIESDNLSPPLNPPGPIQVFDCPQRFIEAPGGPSPQFDSTQFQVGQPGLNLTNFTAQGGYYNTVKRFEGSIEDIVIWNTALEFGDGARERSTKLNIANENTDEILNFWPMVGGNQRVIEEASGRGNHLYFAPDFPVYDDLSGGIQSDTAASWWFNGSTSYAMPKLEGNPNWRERQYFDGDDLRGGEQFPGFIAQAIKKSGNLGIQVDFTPDAIEPFEMVLAEIHGVMRCVVRPDGRLGLYTWDVVASTDPKYHQYRGCVASNTIVKPGRRYIAQFLIDDNTAIIALNGIADASATVTPSISTLTMPPGGMTVGMGMRRSVSNSAKVSGSTTIASVAPDIIRISTAGDFADVREGDIITIAGTGTVDGTYLTKPKPEGGSVLQAAAAPLTLYVDALVPTTAATPGTITYTSSQVGERAAGSANALNTDFRSGFLGRIEQVKILAGEALDELVSARDESDQDYQFEVVPLYIAPDRSRDSNPSGFAESRDTITALDSSVSAPDVALGQGIQIGRTGNLSADQSQRTPELYVNSDADITAADGLTPPVPFAGHPDTGFLASSGARVRVFYTVARWVLDATFDDEEIQYGRYLNNVEWRQSTNIFKSTVDIDFAAPDPVRFVARQNTPVTDQVGFFGALEARCIESDILTEAERNRINDLGGTDPDQFPVREDSFIPGRIWQEFSPREVGPRWSRGLVLPNLDDARISLIADWDDQRSDERFVFTAVGRSLYWVKPIWRAESPFNDDTGSLWLSGQPGEHVRATHSNANQRLAQNTSLNTEAWVYPQRLDGTRVLWTLRNTANGQTNYFVGVRNGSLFVCGTAGTSSWLYHEGSNRTSTLGTDQVEGRLSEGSLRMNAWSHVHVAMTPSGVVAWVNGQRVDLTLYDGSAVTGGFQATALSGSLSPDNVSDFYLGGLPQGRQEVTLNDAASLPSTQFSFTTQAWSGYITEFRSANAVDTRFPAGTANASGAIPQRRYADATGASTLYRLGEKEGWVFPNLVGSAGAANSAITELVLVADNLYDSRNDRYDFAVFRDRLYITNGVGRMQEISFTRYSDPEGPFRVHNAGMLAPTIDPERETLTAGYAGSRLIERSLQNPYPVTYSGDPLAGTRQPAVPLTTGTDTSFLPGNSIYQVWMTFVDAQQRESSPVLLGELRFDADVRLDEQDATGQMSSATQFTTNFPAVGDIEVNIPVSAFDFPDGQPQEGQFVGLSFENVAAAGGSIGLGTYVARYKETTGDFAITRYHTFTLPGTSAAVAKGTVNTTAQVQVLRGSINIDGLPRSTDSQCIDRNIYLGVNGAPVFHSSVGDNVSNEYQVNGLPPSTRGLGFVGRNLVPPRARLVAVDQGALVLANLPELDAGRGAVAYSDPTEVTYFPVENSFVLDSEDGEAIVGMGSQLGRFYVSKRNSIWQIVPGQSVRPINQTVGVGGGFTLYDNLMFGSGERGVYQFDGANVVYSSSSLEGDWRDIPVTDQDLLNHFGAFNRDDSQWWLSVRAPTELIGEELTMRSNRRIYVLHTQAGDSQSWTRLTVPPHTYMRQITDPVSQRPLILLGCEDGRLLRYNKDVFIDGQSDEPGPGRIAAGETDQLLLTFCLPNGTRSFPLTGPGPLDTIQAGLRGMQVIIADGAGFLTVTRIVSNTANTVELEIAPPANALAAFECGSYQAYYTTPWVATHPDHWLKTKHMYVEFAPTDADIVLKWAAAIQNNTTGTLVAPNRKWDVPAAEEGSQTIDARRGYMIDGKVRMDTANRGRYLRMRVQTSPIDGTLVPGATLGIRNPWVLQAIGVEYENEGHQGSGQG